MSGPRGNSRHAACQAISSYQHRLRPTTFAHAETELLFGFLMATGSRRSTPVASPPNRRQAVYLYGHWVHPQKEPYERWWLRHQRTIEVLCLGLDENGRMAVDGPHVHW